MSKITYVASDGTETTIDAEAMSVMQAAVINDVDGIVAECGGSLMCATCHVYVADPWIDKLPPRTDLEDTMLDSTACPRAHNSRLSCQLQITDALDGLVVRLPEEQL